eukprot:4858829-Pyramimonas_sp.AAC.2
MTTSVRLVKAASRSSEGHHMIYHLIVSKPAPMIVRGEKVSVHSVRAHGHDALPALHPNAE